MSLVSFITGAVRRVPFHVPPTAASLLVSEPFTAPSATIYKPDVNTVFSSTGFQTPL